MRKHLILVFIFSFILTSCNSEKAQLSSISKIATSFDTSNQTELDGGVIIVGERSDAPGSVTYTSPDGRSLEIKMERGDWNFYGVGYSGDSNSDGTYDGKFLGSKKCGWTSASIRGERARTLKINFSAVECSGVPEFKLKFKNITPHPCSGFYNYDTNTNTFLIPAPSVYTPISTCVLTAEQKASLSYFKVSALTSDTRSNRVGFSSNCTPLGTVANHLSLPTENAPLQISYYRSLAECQASLKAHNTFSFLKGLNSGDQLRFDHHLEDISTTDTRLILPASLTRRFKSPFMNEIPRILCDGGTDCSLDPNLDHHVVVPWTGNLQKQLIWRDFPEKSCSKLLVNSKFFSIADCTVKNRHVYATVARNELSCRPGVSPMPDFIDLYARNNRVYILVHSSDGKSIALVYTSQGVLLDTLELTNDHTIQSISASDSGILFAASANDILRFDLDSSGKYIAIATGSFGFGAGHIEVDTTGKFLFTGQTNGVIEVRKVSDGSVVDQVTYPGDVYQLQLLGTELYSLVFDTIPYDPANGRPTIDAGFIQRTEFNLSTGELTEFPLNYVPGGVGTLPGLIAGNYFQTNFYVEDNLLYLVNHNAEPGWFNGVTILRRNLETNNWEGFQGPSGSPDVTHIVNHKGRTYIINGTTLENYQSREPWTNQTTNSNCSETVALTSGSYSAAVRMTVNETPVIQPEVSDVYETGMKVAGKKEFTDLILNTFKYAHLNEEQQINGNGGRINRAQWLLGTNGIGGMLHEFNSCDDLKTLVSVGPYSKNFPVDDPYTGYKSYKIKVSKNDEVINSFICDDSAPYNPCSTRYDIKVRVQSTGLFVNEVYQLKLSCNNKIGQLNYVKFDSTEEIKEKIHWNTNQIASSRYDYYRSYNSEEDFSSEMLLTLKTSDSDLWARNINYKKTDLTIMSSASEYIRDISSHGVKRINVEDTISGYTSNANYLLHQGSTSFGGETPDSCFDVGTRSLGPVAMLCTINSSPHPNAENLPLSIDTLDNSDDPDSLFQSIFLKP